MILLGSVIAYAIYKYVTTEHFSTGIIVIPIAIGIVFILAGLYITFKL
jgi:hypothetical protein